MKIRTLRTVSYTHLDVYKRQDTAGNETFLSFKDYFAALPQGGYSYQVAKVQAIGDGSATLTLSLIHISSV